MGELGLGHADTFNECQLRSNRAEAFGYRVPVTVSLHIFWIKPHFVSKLTKPTVSTRDQHGESVVAALHLQHDEHPWAGDGPSGHDPGWCPVAFRSGCHAL